MIAACTGILHEIVIEEVQSGDLERSVPRCERPSHDLSVPADLAVIGYNNIPQAQAFAPPLRTVKEDDHRAGSLLVEKLMQMRDGARISSVRLGVSLTS